MSALTAALLAELDDDALSMVAERLAPIVAARIGDKQRPSAWLDVSGAAYHLACLRSRIYALVSARRIPHHRDGSRLLFQRGELDDWVRNGDALRP